MKRSLIFITIIFIISSLAFSIDLSLNGKNPPDAISSAELLAERSGNSALLTRAGWLEILYGGDMNKAEIYLKEALSSGVSNMDASLALGFIYSMKGDIPKAVMVECEALSSDPSNNLAEILISHLRGIASYNLETKEMSARSVEKALSSNNTITPQLRHSLNVFRYSLISDSLSCKDRDDAVSRIGFIQDFFFSKDNSYLPRLTFYQNLDIAEPKEGEWKFHHFSDPFIRASLPDLEEEGIYRAISYFYIPEDINSEISIFSNTSARFKMDHNEISDIDYYQEFTSPNRWVSLKFHKGWHKLEVFISHTSAQRGFQFSILDKNGIPVKGIKFVKSFSEIPSMVSNITEIKQKSDNLAIPQDERSQGLMGLLDMGMANNESAIMNLTEAVETQPSCSIWWYILGDASFQKSTSLPKEIAQSRSLKAYEKSLELWESNRMASYRISYINRVSGSPEKALKTLTGLKEENPDCYYWYFDIASIFSEKDWLNERRKIVKEIELRFPSSIAALEIVRAYYKDMDDLSNLRRIDEKIDSLSPSEETMMDYYETVGDNVSFESELKKRMEERGDWDYNYNKELIDLYIRSNRLDEAKNAIEEGLNEHPQWGYLYDRLAHICFLKGESKKGEEIWDKNLQENPDSLYVITSKIALNGFIPFDGETLPSEKVMKEKIDDAIIEKSSSAYLLDQMFTEFKKNGSAINRYHAIIKVFSREGIEEEGEVKIPENSMLLNIHTIKSDGRILEPEKIPQKETISMPNLEPGDLIEYEYIQFEAPSTIKKNSYVAHAIFNFAGIEKPFLHTQWKVKIPKDLTLQMATGHLPSPPIESFEGDEKIIDWDYRNMEKISFEPNYSDKYDFIPYASISFGITWDDIFLFMKDSMIGRFRSGFEVKRAAEKAVHGINDDSEKIKAIARYLRDNIGGEGVSLDDPSVVIATKSGGRIALCKAMFDSMMLRNNLAFIKPVTDRNRFQSSPNLFTYTQPLLNIPLNKKDSINLFLPSAYLSYDYIPWILYGSQGIVVDKDKKMTFIKIPPMSEGLLQNKSHEVLHLHADGSAALDIDETLNEEVSGSIRQAFSSLAKDQWSKAMEMALSQRFSNMHLDKFEITNLVNKDENLRWNYSVTIKEYSSLSNGVLKPREIVSPVNITSAFGTLKERELPLSPSEPIFLEESVDVELPEESSLFTPLPKSIHLALASPLMGYYDLIFSEKKGGISIKRNFYLPYEVIEPVDYPKFLSFLKSVDETEGFDFRVKCPSSAQETPK